MICEFRFDFEVCFTEATFKWSFIAVELNVCSQTSLCSVKFATIYTGILLQAYNAKTIPFNKGNDSFHVLTRHICCVISNVEMVIVFSA